MSAGIIFNDFCKLTKKYILGAIKVKGGANRAHGSVARQLSKLKVPTTHGGGGAAYSPSAHSEGYCSCSVCCMCLFALICCLTHWNHKREIPMDSSQYRNHLIFCVQILLKMLSSKVMA